MPKNSTAVTSYKLSQVVDDTNLSLSFRRSAYRELLKIAKSNKQKNESGLPSAEGLSKREDG